MIVQLLAEQHLEFLSLKGGCTGWPGSTLVKMPHCGEITCHGSMYFVLLGLVLFKAVVLLLLIRC